MEIRKASTEWIEAYRVEIRDILDAVCTVLGISEAMVTDLTMIGDFFYVATDSDCELAELSVVLGIDLTYQTYLRDAAVRLRQQRTRGN